MLTFINYMTNDKSCHPGPKMRRTLPTTGSGGKNGVNELIQMRALCGRTPPPTTYHYL